MVDDDLYFDYDVAGAKMVGQGNKKVLNYEEFIILPEDYLNHLVHHLKYY